jgi:hypothetical protein
MNKRIKEVPVEEETLADNEEYISRDDVDIEVRVMEDEPVIMVQFSGFEDAEDAEEYAQFLADNLPLLLFETTRLQ